MIHAAVFSLGLGLRLGGPGTSPAPPPQICNLKLFPRLITVIALLRRHQTTPVRPSPPFPCLPTGASRSSSESLRISPPPS